MIKTIFFYNYKCHIYVYLLFFFFSIISNLSLFLYAVVIDQQFNYFYGKKKQLFLFKHFASYNVFG